MINKIFCIIFIIAVSFISIDLAVVGALVYNGLRGVDQSED